MRAEIFIHIFSRSFLARRKKNEVGDFFAMRVKKMLSRIEIYLNSWTKLGLKLLSFEVEIRFCMNTGHFSFIWFFFIPIL